MRTVDPAVERAVNAVSPRNIYNRPVHRVVWSPDAMHWACGWWNDYDNHGAFVRRVFEARRCPKYQFASRWVVEKWHPPEFFGSREHWDKVTAEYTATHGTLLELGPYPSEGDYVFMWKCENVDGSYLEITPTLAQYAVDLDLLPMQTEAEMRLEIEERQKRSKLAERNKIIDQVIDEFPFLGRPNNLNPKSLLDKIRADNKEKSQ